MKTLNRKYRMMRVMAGGMLVGALMMAITPTAAPSKVDNLGIERAKLDLKMTTIQALEEPQMEAVHPVKTPLPKQTAFSQAFPGLVEVVQETYVEEEILDESWDEEAYVEEQRRLLETMTEEELAARAQIKELEIEFNKASDDFEPNEEMVTQLENLLVTEDEQPPQMLDLRCTSTLCRITVSVVDEYSQAELLDTLPDQLGWVGQSYADVIVKPDDSRVLTLFLVRSVDS